MKKFLILLLVIAQISVVSGASLTVNFLGFQENESVQVKIYDEGFKEVYNDTLTDGMLTLDNLKEGLTYHIVSQYKGVLYGRTVVMNNSETIEIQIYEPTDDVSLIISPFHHILIKPAGDLFEVIEVISLENTGDKAFKGELKIKLPDGFVQVKSPEIPGIVEQDGVRFNYSLPPEQPGRLVLIYYLPALTFERVMDFDTSMMSILIENGENILLDYSNLQPEGTVTFNNKQYYALYQTNGSKGEVVTVTFRSFGTPSQDTSPLGEGEQSGKYFSTTVAWIGAGVILVLIFFVGYINYQSRMPSLEKLEAQKESLLAVLEELEKDYEDGKLDDEEYARLKAKYKKEAMKVMARLDHLKEKQSDHEEDNDEEEE